MTILYLYEYDTKVNFSQNRLIIESNSRNLELPVETVQGVVLFGGVQLTGRVFTYLLEKEIPVIWLSKTGKFYGRLESTSSISISKQRMQFRCGDDKHFCLEISKNIVNAKIRNQKVVLTRYNRTENINEVDSIIDRLEKGSNIVYKAKTLNELVGYEGHASKLYFEGLSYIIKGEYSFKGRSKQPPRDKFNSLLSFGYTLLMYDVYSAINISGLNPYAAFLHQDRERHPTLASDLMEEWRSVIVDSIVINVIKRNMLNVNEFRINDDGGVYIGSNNIKTFIKEYESKIESKSKYLQQVDYELSYRKAFVEQSKLLSTALEKKDPSIYKPVIIR